jgi:hypothetical protein
MNGVDFGFCVIKHAVFVLHDLPLDLPESFIANPLNAAMSATLIAFCLNCAAFIWVFMVQKTLKATLGIAVPCIALYALLKFLG